MPIPKDLRGLSSILLDHNDCSILEYLFTYQNSFGDKISLFRDKVVLLEEGRMLQLHFGDIKSVVLDKASMNDPAEWSVTFNSNEARIKFKVNTASRGGFFDVFPVYRSITRALVQFRSQVVRAKTQSAG